MSIFDNSISTEDIQRLLENDQLQSNIDRIEQLMGFPSLPIAPALNPYKRGILAYNELSESEIRDILAIKHNVGSTDIDTKEQDLKASEHHLDEHLAFIDQSISDQLIEEVTVGIWDDEFIIG